MATSTATIERINLISAARPMTETPVESINSEADDVVDYSIPLYVTSTEYEHRAERYVGRVVKVRRRTAREDSWWAWDEEDTINVSVKGAKLNPPMVNGRYYRSLDGHGMLVRYNDDDHAGDRNLESCSLSILATNGQTWPVPGDGTNWTDNFEYIEVERPESEAEVTDAHQFLADTSIDGPARGLAKPDTGGRVPLKPEPIPGAVYLVWGERENEPWTTSRTTYVAMVLGAEEDGAPAFTYTGYYNTLDGAPRYVADEYTYPNGSDIGRLVWVELALSAGTVDEEATAGGLYTKTTEERQAFEELNEALNELADDNDWCSDYESIIEPLGMNGRNKNKDWVVEVDVTFTFTDENPPSEFDEKARDRYGLGDLEITSAEYSATARINVHVSDTSEDGARDYIDTTMLDDELRERMSHASSIDVSDYDIYSVEED